MARTCPSPNTCLLLHSSEWHALLARAPVRRHPQLFKRLVGVAVLLSNPVDSPCVIGCSNVAVQRFSERDHLLDLLNRCDTLPFTSPQVVLNATPDVQPHGNRDRTERE